MQRTPASHRARLSVRGHILADPPLQKSDDRPDSPHPPLSAAPQEGLPNTRSLTLAGYMTVVGHVHFADDVHFPSLLTREHCRRAHSLLGNSLMRSFIANPYWQNRRTNRGANERAVADKEIMGYAGRSMRDGPRAWRDGQRKDTQKSTGWSVGNCGLKISSPISKSPPVGRSLFSYQLEDLAIWHSGSHLVSNAVC